MYDPQQDLYFQKAILNRELAEESIKSYAKTVKVWQKATNQTLTETVEKIKPLQRGKITPDNYIIEYDPNDSQIKTYFDIFIHYLLSNGKKDTTIAYYIKVMRLILKEVGIKLPDPPRIKVQKNKKQVLRKEDIKYIFNISNIHYKSFYCFLACTGIRVSDAARFTINDWLDATYDYHHCRDLNTFLEKTHEPMLGYWEFVPKKTRNSSGIVCKVCNTYESNEYIIQSIHERIKNIEKKNRLLNTDVVLEGNDPLFPLQKNYYKEKINRYAVVNASTRKNRKFQDKLARDLQADLENNKLSNHQYQKLLDNRIQFHANALRSFFISTIRAYCSNRDISLTMEAHVSDIKTDENYVGESDELFNKEMFIEHYLSMINHLTFNVEIDPEQLEKLTLENQKLEREIAEVKRVAQNEAVKRVDDILSKYGF